MEIFSAEQIRSWDQYTIQNEPISSLDLMERAAGACFTWMEQRSYAGRSFSIFCGKGNNGGDGLVLARLLSGQASTVVVYILEFGHKGTDDFQANLERLHNTTVEVRFIQGAEHFPAITSGEVLIDALFGSGLNRALDGVTAQLVEHLNTSGNEIISIDMPSGLFVDRSSKGGAVVKATHTLSFACYKLAFLVPENAAYTGELHILDIGLSREYVNGVSSRFELLDLDIIRAIYRPRTRFAHKGSYGHALLIAGAYGKMGAAVLSSRACLQAGAGLLSVHVPRCGYEIMQISIPEAMILADNNETIQTNVGAKLDSYSVVGVGPGIGTEHATRTMLISLLQSYKRPMLLDADALNILGLEPGLLERMPPYSILTPHPKEFERMFGSATDDFARLELALEKAKLYQCVIVLKGHYTFIAMPGGKGFFNSTGNPGMAKGGSGDALTGILTALLSQGYAAGEAAILGVYLHGLAGDLAAADVSQEAMLASDLIDHLGKAFLSIGGK